MELNFKRYEGNPILKPNKNNQWENLCVLNPAVVFDQDTNKFVMVYRAGGDETVSIDAERRNDGEFAVDGVDLAVHVSSIRSSHESFSSR